MIAENVQPIPRNILTMANWFIQKEKERVLLNFDNGTIGREQAIGSLSTLYQMASELHEIELMQRIWYIISIVRSVEHPVQMKPLLRAEVRNGSSYIP